MHAIYVAIARPTVTVTRLGSEHMRARPAYLVTLRDGGGYVLDTTAGSMRTAARAMRHARESGLVVLFQAGYSGAPRVVNA